MEEIPIFPLNSVLLPGAPLQLFIFENRYKSMISDCLQKESPIGIVLIKKGREAFGPIAEPYYVGTSARIKHVEKKEKGRLQVNLTGEDRFRLIRYEENSSAYLLGQVKEYPLENSGTEILKPKMEILRKLVADYFQMINQALKQEFSTNTFPDTASDFAFLSASILPVPAKDKQAILISNSESVLLDQVINMYRKEISLGQTMLSIEPKGSIGAFSQN